MRFNDAQWRDRMRLRLDFNNMMKECIGERGIDISELQGIIPQCETAVELLEQKRGSMQWRGLPYNQEDILKDVKSAAESIRRRFDNFVVLGIGGSALGPIAVHQALCHLRYNELEKDRRNGPRFYVEDNVDPERMAALLDVIDVENTAFNVITKSGSTSETMAQLLIITGILREKLGDEIGDRIIATTDRNRGNLIKIARDLNLTTLYVPDGVGGRFSELCPVGLLPAAVCGIDIDGLLAGARYMDELCSSRRIMENPACMLAALEVIAMQKEHNISVMMPYADSLRYFADWYAQLWAESLGKRYDNNGKEVFCGQTPVKALGVTDQHSQVQLYTEGPFDKVITFIGVERFRREVMIPHAYDHIRDVAFLSGHTLNDLISAERYATEYAVKKSGHLSKTIMLPEVNPFTIGQLICLLEMQTAYAGELLNINAFDQPGVEEGKTATYALLGKPGYEDKRSELNGHNSRLEKYII